MDFSTAVFATLAAANIFLLMGILLFIFVKHNENKIKKAPDHGDYYVQKRDTPRPKINF